jgi:hypothetical protein
MKETMTLVREAMGLAFRPERTAAPISVNCQ